MFMGLCEKQDGRRKGSEMIAMKLDWPEDGWADEGREPDPKTPEPEIEIWIPDEPVKSDDDNNDNENRE